MGRARSSGHDRFDVGEQAEQTHVQFKCGY